MSGPTPEEVVKGSGERADAIIRAEAGKALKRAKKRPPLKPGRGNYVRAYSYSMMAFAARCLYLGEMLDEANAALAENAQHYLDNPKDINDRDSFHWHAETALRLIEMYGVSGTKHAGRISAETEAVVLQPIFAYAKQYSTPARSEYQKSETWHIYESENHHVMSFTVCWHFSRLAKDRPKYRGVVYNGHTPAEHYDAWNDYFVAYCQERARKGLFIEMMCASYNSTLLKGIYNFYDFGEPAVRRAAGMLLDLYLAYWAQEQIGGVSGGGKSRVYFKGALNGQRHNGTKTLAWVYFGIGERPHLAGHDLNALMSDYRPPPVVADLALDVAGRGTYEVRQRPQGLGVSGNRNPYRMKTNGGGIVRYSYCDPGFVIGTPMTAARPLGDWAAISSQNRWQGAIFSGAAEARIVPIVRPKDNRVALNASWSVQSKGSLITQKLSDNQGGAEMIVWFSDAGLGEPVEEDGIVFVESEAAYAAVRVAQGGYSWREEPYSRAGRESLRRYIPPGRTLVPRNPFAPVILEVMSKRHVASLDVFRARVQGSPLSIDGTILRYTTIYGDTLTLDTSYKELPTVNGGPVDLTPEKAFESPFLWSVYNSGVVIIRKGDREQVLDFNTLDTAVSGQPERPSGLREVMRPSVHELPSGSKSSVGPRAW